MQRGTKGDLCVYNGVRGKEGCKNIQTHVIVNYKITCNDTKGYLYVHEKAQQ